MFKLYLTILYNGNVIKKCIFLNTLQISIKQIKQLISRRIFISKELDFVRNIDVLHMNKFLSDNTKLKEIYNNDICYLTIILYNSKL